MVSISLPARVGQWLHWWNSPASCFPDAAEFAGFHSLAKASVDRWDYAVGLHSGIVILCSESKRRGDIIDLMGIRKVLDPSGNEVLHGDFLWGRGMEVKLSAIAWSADGGS
jgi:hypothetical protein